MRFERFPGIDSVRIGTLASPVAVPDPRSLDDRVRIDGVHPDSVRRTLERQAPGQVQCRGLGGSVSRRVHGRGHGVLRAYEHDRARFLRLHQRESRARRQEITQGQHVMVGVPQLQRGLFHRCRRGDPGIGHQNVQAAELACALGKRRTYLRLVRHVAHC